MNIVPTLLAVGLTWTGGLQGGLSFSEAVSVQPCLQPDISGPEEMGRGTRFRCTYPTAPDGARNLEATFEGGHLIMLLLQYDTTAIIEQSSIQGVQVRLEKAINQTTGRRGTRSKAGRGITSELWDVSKDRVEMTSWLGVPGIPDSVTVLFMLKK